GTHLEETLERGLRVADLVVALERRPEPEEELRIVLVALEALARHVRRAPVLVEPLPRVRGRERARLVLGGERGEGLLAFRLVGRLRGLEEELRVGRADVRGLRAHLLDDLARQTQPSAQSSLSRAICARRLKAWGLRPSASQRRGVRSVVARP